MKINGFHQNTSSAVLSNFLFFSFLTPIVNQQQIVVEYDPAEVDRFIEAADVIEDAFPGLIVEGVEVDDRPHAFDVLLEDGTKVFERVSESAEVPSAEELVVALSEAGVRPAAAAA